MKRLRLMTLAVAGLFILAPTEADAGFVVVAPPVYYGSYYRPAHYGPYWYVPSWGRSYWWHGPYRAWGYWHGGHWDVHHWHGGWHH